jgi:hypothetical protein
MLQITVPIYVFSALVISRSKTRRLPINFRIHPLTSAARTRTGVRFGA